MPKGSEEGKFILLLWCGRSELHLTKRCAWTDLNGENNNSKFDRFTPITAIGDFDKNVGKEVCVCVCGGGLKSIVWSRRVIVLLLIIIKIIILISTNLFLHFV